MSDEDSQNEIKPLKDESYLPSWILDMRKKLEKSKTASTHADKQINGILKDVAGLTTKLNDANEATKLHQKKLADNQDEKSNELVSGMNILDLPDDMICIVLQFLVAQDVMNVESTRKEVKGMIEASNYWLASYSDQFNRFKASGQLSFRDFIVNKEQCIVSALTFIRVLKERRSVPRFRNIEPHRYHRGESGVSHPFPIVEAAGGNKVGTLDEQSISTTMMSRVETMNNDFRSFALLSMRDISELTSYEYDVIHLKLVQCGAVAVLVSLLSSESDVLRQYSCESLANLLCWETRFILNFERFSYLHSSVMSSSGRTSCLLPSSPSHRPLEGIFLPNAPLTHRPLRDQLQVCDARRQLSALLTSPSACVNLAQSRARGVDVNEPMKESGVNNRMTAAVQGLASKAACRVLINLFAASDCLPSPQRNSVMFGEKSNVEKTQAVKISESDDGVSDNSMPKRNSPESTSTTRKITNSKLPRNSKVSTGTGGGGGLAKKSAPVSRQRVHVLSKSHENESKNSKTNPASSSSLPASKGSRKLKTVKPTSSLSIPKSISQTFRIIPSKPWKFIYYHKSGFVKDTHVVWLQFLDEQEGVQAQFQEIRGRGEDSTGLFFLKGHVNKDIEGYSWQIEKCYVKKPLASKAASLLLLQQPLAGGVLADSTEEDTAYEVSRDIWCRNELGEWIDKEEISSWGRPHISHTAYHSEIVTDAVVTEAFVNNQRVSAVANLRKRNPHFFHTSGAMVSGVGGNINEQSFREDRSFYESHDRQRVEKNASTAGDSKAHSLRQSGEEYHKYVRFNTQWGGGMFGVWEVSTTEAHFELIKGGVFRATPMMATSM